MAKYSNDVVYNIKTTLDASGVTQLRNELTKLKTTLTANDATKITGLHPAEIKQSIKEINQLEVALKKAFNPKINSLDLSKLNTSLRMTDTNLQGIAAR